MSERLEFTYHRSLGPMIGVLLGIAIVEMLVVHLVVVTMFGWIAAVIVGVLDLSLVVALISLLRSFRRLPVTIGDGVLTMRAGWLKSVAVPVEQIAASARHGMRRRSRTARCSTSRWQAGRAS